VITFQHFQMAMSIFC